MPYNIRKTPTPLRAGADQKKLMKSLLLYCFQKVTYIVELLQEEALK